MIRLSRRLILRLANTYSNCRLPLRAKYLFSQANGPLFYSMRVEWHRPMSCLFLYLLNLEPVFTHGFLQ